MSAPLRILMLEDRATDAELNERLVRKAGIACTVQRVETEAAFRQQLHEFRPGLILADYHLPTWDGRSALAVTLSESPEVPFIFVTGTLGEETAVEALLSGAADFVLKQRAERLGEAVLRALRDVANSAALRESERHLRDSETRYRGLFESAHDGILVIDVAAGMIVDANPSLCDLLGLTLHQLRGKPADAFAFLEQVIARHADVQGSPLERSVVTRDQVATASDGRRCDLSITSSVRLVNGRQVIQCDIHDMTERNAAAAELARQLDELRRWQAVMLGREDRIEELKREVNTLSDRLGLPVRYLSAARAT